MYPVLYKSDETNFIHNGLGLLTGTISAVATEELNGMFELNMQYDNDGFLADMIDKEMIIKAKANDKQEAQLFRIYSITKNHENDNLIIDAVHITNDLANNFVEKLEARNLTKRQVMELIGSSTAYPHPFNVTSSNSTTQSSTSLYRTNPLQMIAGMDGSVLQFWGGQIERDNFHLIMHDRRGSDDGVLVTYKKNLTGLTAKFDISNLVTRIYPFIFKEATDNEPEKLITVPGKYIDSPHIDDHEMPHIFPVDFSNEEGVETSQELFNVASKWFVETGRDKPKVEMEVQFEHLWETEEYKDVAALELVGMGDTITVKHSKLKVEGAAIVNRIEYDVIAEKNLAVDVGNVKAKFTDKVNKASDVVNKITEIQQTANQAITAANGKNRIYYGPDEPSGNLNEGDLWFRVVDGEYTRTYRYDGIQWKLIVSADIKDIEEIANEAHNQADQAVANANLATSNALEAISEAQGAFDEAQTAMSRADSAFNKADALSTKVDDQTGEISSIKQIAQGLQTRVSSAEGSISTLQQTSSSFATRIENAEGDISSLTQTTQGLQTAVSNKADKSTVTQLAGVVDSKITKGQADGWYASQSQLTQTASSLQSTITSVRNELGELEYENRNLIPNSQGDNLEGWTTWGNTALSILDGTIRVRASTSTSNYGAVTPKFEVEAGKQYTFSLDIASNFNTDVLDYVYILFDAHSNQRVSSIVMSSAHADLRRYSITFTSNYTGSASMLLGAYVKNTNAEGFLLERVKLERGTKSTPYSTAPIDTQSQISQLSNNINFRVLKDDVINQINVSTESILISGKKLILDGDTTVTGTFRVANANITSVDAGKMTTGTLDAGRVSVINLSANSIIGGILQSQNSNIQFNLNTGTLDVNSNASIRFNGTGGGMKRVQGGRQAFVSYAISSGSDSPMVSIGAISGSGTVNVNDVSFRGIRLHADNVSHTNDLVNDTWTFTRRVDQSLGAVLVDLSAGTKGIIPQFTGIHSYNLGAINNRWSNLYIDYIRGVDVDIRNTVGNGGWRFQTQPESGSTSMALIGINQSFAGYTYNLGTSPSPFNFGWINHLRPTGSSSSVGASGDRYNYVYTNNLVNGSDISLKDNIKDSELGLDFINDLHIVDFRMIDSGQFQTGVIAQELEATLIDHGVDINKQSMVFTNDDVMGVSYIQLIPPTIKGLQNLDFKVDTEVSRLRKQNEELILKVAHLEARINKLEVA